MDTTAFAISAVVVAAISGAFTFLNVYHYHPWSAHHWLVNALLLFYALFIAVFIVVALSTYFLLRPQPIIALRLLLEFTLLNGQSSQLYVLTRVLKKFYRLATFFIVTAAFFIQTVGFGLWNSARSNHARIVYSVGTVLFQLILAVLACYHQILLSRVSRQCGLHGKVARRKFIFASGTFVTGAGCVVAFAFVFEAEAFFLAVNSSQCFLTLILLAFHNRLFGLGPTPPPIHDGTSTFPSSTSNGTPRSSVSKKNESNSGVTELYLQNILMVWKEDGKFRVKVALDIVFRADFPAREVSRYQVKNYLLEEFRGETFERTDHYATLVDEMEKRVEEQRGFREVESFIFHWSPA